MGFNWRSRDLMLTGYLRYFLVGRKPGTADKKDDSAQDGTQAAA